MKKKTYFIILGILVVILVALSTILIIKGPVKVDKNKYGTEAKTYLKTFDIELSEDEQYYIIKGLTTTYGATLTRIEFPDTIDGIVVKKITTNENKFGEYKNVKSIFIPKSVDFIGLDDLKTENYFDGAINLMNIEVDENNENFISIDGVLYDKAKENLLKFPSTKTSRNYNILETTKKIYANAFFGCFYLESIFIPQSVSVIGSSAFRNSSALKTVLFEDNSKLEEIEELAFAYLDYLEEIILPTNLVKLGSGALSHNKALRYVFVPSNISYFGYNITSSSSNVNLYTTQDNLDNLKANSRHFNTSKDFENRIFAILDE